MRPRLLACDPVKYSSRQTLENDLRVLAAACNHTLPKRDDLDLEDLIRKKKDDCRSHVTSKSSHYSPRTPPSRYHGDRSTATLTRDEQRLPRQKSTPGIKTRALVGDEPWE
ncbi:hypothetical protein OS493_018184 [Desmophyllum pertusum]|uniref:Uncharacterized protein n=1 Tax=Desmophyllum pertusum TaxID=174260 RepID=A0A9X0CKG6_9CNID|nr:hypothetical protein OS493_018184 [Desmophyllum pertusum]